MGLKAGILICGETSKGKITGVTRELIQAGREQSGHSKGPLSLLLIGRDIRPAAEDASALGVEKIYCVDEPPFMASLPDRHTAILAQVCRETEPSLVLLGQTDMGRDVAPRLAALIGAPVCLDCVGLAFDPDDGACLQTKPVYGGNARAVWSSKDSGPPIVTLRPRTVEPAEPEASRRGEIVSVADLADAPALKGKLVESVKEEVKGIRVEEAKVVVAGGGGIGGAEGFALLEALAGMLGGGVGISRVPRDEGWQPGGFEIGQTGHIVSPGLYFAVGISGAPQHMAGCAGSKCIVAINRDPEANIFKEADFGIVGDYRKILPVLIEKFKP